MVMHMNQLSSGISTTLLVASKNNYTAILIYRDMRVCVCNMLVCLSLVFCDLYSHHLFKSRLMVVNHEAKKVQSE